MPVNKDAMARYRIIDRMLADPHKDYTTKDIERAVSRECPKVSTRMIQKDIKALEEPPFNKKVLRGKGGRGTVRYEDQSNPLFFQEPLAGRRARSIDNAGFEEITGVTGKKDGKGKDIYFAVKPQAVKGVRTKCIHPSQDEVNPEAEKEFKARYPSLKGCKFFVINCRPNVELYARFASYRDTVIIVEPADVRATMMGLLEYTLKNYKELD